MTLRDLLAAATNGPWSIDQHGIDNCLADVWTKPCDDEERICENATIEDARLIALAPSLAAALLVAEKALRPFSEMAGEMFAANWNDDGVAISIVTKDGPMRITFKEFREARAALAEIDKLMEGKG